MTYNAEKLKKEMISLETFEWNSEKGDLDETTIKPEMFICQNGLLHVSGEDGKGFVDYYGEFRGGYPYIDPKLEAWAKDQNGFWEWDNPGSIVFVEN